MSLFTTLKNLNPFDDGILTCKDLPFLPVCEQREIARQRGGRFARPTTKCTVGTVTGTYSNGDPFMGEVVERSQQGEPSRVHRDIKLPSGMTFQMKNSARQDGTFDRISDGETLALDVVESGLVGSFNLHEDDARICRSQAYAPFGQPVVQPVATMPQVGPACDFVFSWP